MCMPSRYSPCCVNSIKYFVRFQGGGERQEDREKERACVKGQRNSDACNQKVGVTNKKTEGRAAKVQSRSHPNSFPLPKDGVSDVS